MWVRIIISVDSFEIVFAAEIRSVKQGFCHDDTDGLALSPYGTA
jgi:hypothetical protein